MRNLFGKIRVAEACGFSAMIADEMGIPALEARAKEIVNKHKEAAPESEIADLVLDGLKKCVFFRRFVPENTDAVLQETIQQDLKLLMLASHYYYHYLYDKPKFNVVNKALPCFNDNFKPTHQKSKKDGLKSHGIPIPLQSLVLESNAAQNFSQQSVLDVGLALGISAGTSGLTNPYLVPYDPGILKIRTFLNGFRYALIDRTETEDLYDQLSEIPATVSPEAYAEAYAVLNQFCIERLTNLNFIIACFNVSNLHHGLSVSYSLRRALECWLLIPLFKTRLLMLDMLANGTYGIPESLFSEGILDLYDCVIPVACSVFEKLMDVSGCEIQKDDNYFKQIYADPADSGQNDKGRYMLFRKSDRQQLDPIQKFIATDDKTLKNKLFKCIRTTELDKIIKQWNNSHQDKDHLDRRKHLKTAGNYIHFFKSYITERYKQAIPKNYYDKTRRLEKLSARRDDPKSFIINITTGGKKEKPLPKTQKGLEGAIKQLESELQSILDHAQAVISEDKYCPSLINALGQLNITFNTKTGTFSDNNPYIRLSLDEYCDEGAVSRFCSFARTYFNHFNMVMTPHNKRASFNPIHEDYRSSYSWIDFSTDIATFDCFNDYDEMIISIKRNILNYPGIMDEITETYKKFELMKAQTQLADKP